jgi:hypothetical protein
MGSRVPVAKAEAIITGPSMPSHRDKARIDVLTLAATISSAKESSHVGHDCRGRGHSRPSCSVRPRLQEERPQLSRGNDLAKAMDYLLKRWPAFTRFPASLMTAASAC